MKIPTEKIHRKRRTGISCTMREIKFRLMLNNKIVGYERWRLTTAKSRMVLEQSKDNIHWHIVLDGNGNRVPLDSIIYICHGHKDQFIGLFDKNGKEIYENDIVRYWRYETGSRGLDGAPLGGAENGEVEIDGQGVIEYGEDGFIVEGFRLSFFSNEDKSDIEFVGVEIIDNATETPNS